MVSFSHLLSPATRARIAKENAEAARLFSLKDAWLAAGILELARKAQRSTPEYSPGQGTYNARLIWGLVPEIARRLGVIRMATEEIDWEIRELSDYDLRIRAGYTLANISHCSLPGWDMLSREVTHGNPVVFAIDRICPERVGDSADPIVCRFTEIARVRNCPFFGVWKPNICGEAPEEIVEEWESDESPVPR